MVRYSALALVASVVAVGAASVTACGNDSVQATNDDAGPTVEPDAAHIEDAGGNDASDASDSGPDVVSTCPHPEEPVTHEFTKIFDPSVGEAKPFYIDGHTFVRDDSGTWHLFGTTHEEPAYLSDEKTFAHATASSLQGPWTKQANALTADGTYGEAVLWSPHVVHEGSTYYMFFSGGGDNRAQSQIELATSTDLVTWTRAAAPLFTDGYDARDPFVVKIGSQWVLYYTATEPSDGGSHVVAYRTSTDLTNWGPKKIAFTDRSSGTIGGPTGSPFVVARGSDYYLFLGPQESYESTAVYHSKDPFTFDPNDVVHRFAAHAAEIVQDTDGKVYASHAGWGEGGVYLTPLEWLTANCERLETTNYRAVVETSPHAAILELSTNGQNVLSTGFRWTGPYLGVANWGDRPAGAAASVTVSQDGKSVSMKGITFPGETVTADWALCAGDHALDLGLAWHVPTDVSGVHEVGLGLSSRFTKVRDASGPVANEQDVAGLGLWSLLSNDTSSLVAAYAPGSAWQEDNHWLSARQGAISYQPFWSLDGKVLPAGDHAGGLYRLAVSFKPDDTAIGAAIAGAIATTPPTCAP